MDELYDAIWRGTTSSALAIIVARHEAGANLNAATPSGITAVHMAGRFNRGRVITALCVAGADMNARSQRGNAPIHEAAKAGNTEALTALIGAGADLNAVNANGATAADLAAQNGHVEALIALCAAGGRPNMVDAEGRALDGAAASHRRQEILDAMALGSERRFMETVVAALQDSSDRRQRNLSVDLTCPIAFHAYTTRGATRPVRLPDGKRDTRTDLPVPGSVLSAAAAVGCLRPGGHRVHRGTETRDPLTRSSFTRAEADAFLVSTPYLQGDPSRLALIEETQQACRHVDLTPAAIREAVTQAMDRGGLGAARSVATMPPYLVVLNAQAAAIAAPSGGDRPSSRCRFPGHSM